MDPRHGHDARDRAAPGVGQLCTGGRNRYDRDVPNRRVIVAVLVGSIVNGAASGAATRQIAPPRGGVDGPPAIAAELPRRAMPVPLRRILVGGPSVLFPEGTYLIRTPGRLFPEADDGLWKFLPDDFGGAEPRAVPLAPSPALESVVAVAIPEAGLDVEVSGEVLAYRGGNWILPELVVPVTRLTPRAELRRLSPAPAPKSASGAGQDSAAPPSVDAASIVPRGEESAVASVAPPPTNDVAPDATAASVPVIPAPSEESDAIERMLRQRIGAVAQSIEVLPAREIALPETAVGFGGVGLEGAIDSGPAAPAESLIVTRRGTIVRDNDRGGWRFISISEDGGDPEPSMRLVPSVVLERVERTIRAAEGPIPILVTGRVLRFRDERWLRLTAWEFPRTGRSLLPG